VTFDVMDADAQGLPSFLFRLSAEVLPRAGERINARLLGVVKSFIVESVCFIVVSDIHPDDFSVWCIVQVWVKEEK
jgi:hypothetical protein